MKPKSELLPLFEKTESLQARIGVILPHPTGVGLIFLINIQKNHAVHDLAIERLEWNCFQFCFLKSIQISKVGDATTAKE